MFGWIGMGLGGWQGGLLFDFTGSYYWSFSIGSIAGVINLLIIYLFRTYIRQNNTKRVALPRINTVRHAKTIQN